MKKIGLYGGRFSPPHNGHIGIAEAFLKTMSLDELIVLPSGRLPRQEHGQTIADAHRLAMTQLAFSSLPQAVVSDYEISQNDFAYTVNTVEYFATQGTIFYLCGEDVLRSLPHWYRAERILALSTIVVACREENSAYTIRDTLNEMRARYKARICLLEHPVLPISSSEIREALAKKEPLKKYLPASVEDYIYAHNLYR